MGGGMGGGDGGGEGGVGAGGIGGGGGGGGGGCSLLAALAARAVWEACVIRLEAPGRVLSGAKAFPCLAALRARAA